jgi:hypothetical protein
LNQKVKYLVWNNDMDVSENLHRQYQAANHAANDYGKVVERPSQSEINAFYFLSAFNHLSVNV